MTLDVQENVDLHHKEEMELTCPWCHTHTITASVNHRTLRLRCNECNMDAFVIQIPRNKKLSDYVPRRLIA